MRKILIPVVVIFLLFWIISSPSSASGSVNNGLGNLQEAGSRLVTFMNGVLN